MKDLKEAEDIMKTWKECKSQQGEKRNKRKEKHNDPDNQDGVIIPTEPVVLNCKVTWALGNTSISKANTSDRIPSELLKIPKMINSKCCNQYVRKYGKPNSGHRTRQGQSLSQFPIPIPRHY